MRAFGSLFVLFFLIFSFLLLCLVAFSGDEFWDRHNWRGPGNSGSGGKVGVSRAMQVDLGRLLCVWVYRIWVSLLIIVCLYLLLTAWTGAADPMASAARSLPGEMEYAIELH